MGMTIDTVTKWLGIIRENLIYLPEVSSDKKIESLDTAILYLKDLEMYQLDYNARPTAHWVERNPKNSKTCRLIECSECGEGYIVGYNVPFEQWIDGRNYCVHCGCKMVLEDMER